MHAHAHENGGIMNWWMTIFDFEVATQIINGLCWLEPRSIIKMSTISLAKMDWGNSIIDENERERTNPQYEPQKMLILKVILGCSE